MSQKAARVGDAICHGGVVTTGSGDVFINGAPAAIAGASSACCGLGHGTTAVVSGSASVFINGAAAARCGDMLGCGSVIVTGSANVFTG
ncbi:PAAR domain-containing protein [[Erwinia] mediterraneensis]|uniref:PAAR domain-containing protein n=1 Tax=[Erwinia] mediterraneensis TaxID=2161819 RepID=UPI00103222F0|nr:PAAR domain-containing protein [[Erwinia] mediterraneensis]